jgi:hypothetical protein
MVLPSLVPHLVKLMPEDGVRTFGIKLAKERARAAREIYTLVALLCLPVGWLVGQREDVEQPLDDLDGASAHTRQRYLRCSPATSHTALLGYDDCNLYRDAV